MATKKMLIIQFRRIYMDHLMPQVLAQGSGILYGSQTFWRNGYAIPGPCPHRNAQGLARHLFDSLHVWPAWIGGIVRRPHFPAANRVHGRRRITHASAQYTIGAHSTPDFAL